MDKLGKIQVHDKINSVPVWKVHGVNLDNRDILLKTDAWLHLSDLGDDGWGVMGSQKQLDDLKPLLTKHGFEVEPWAKLPYKPIGKRFIWMTLIIAFSLFIVALLLHINESELAKLLFASPIIFGVLAIFKGKINAYRCRHLRFATGVSGFFNLTGIKETHSVAPDKQ